MVLPTTPAGWRKRWQSAAGRCHRAAEHLGGARAVRPCDGGRRLRLHPPDARGDAAGGDRRGCDPECAPGQRRVGNQPSADSYRLPRRWPIAPRWPREPLLRECYDDRSRPPSRCREADACSPARCGSRCPVCGGGPMFTGWFRMKEHCPSCGIRMRRGEDGYTLGALWFNLFLAELITMSRLRDHAGPDLAHAALGRAADRGSARGDRHAAAWCGRLRGRCSSPSTSASAPSRPRT